MLELSRFMTGLQAGQASAFHGYLRRFAPALRVFAEQRGIPDADAAVSDALTDFALDVIQRGHPIPPAPHPYFKGIIVHRMLQERRRASNRVLEDKQSVAAEGGGMSEFSLRASHGEPQREDDDTDGDPLSTMTVGGIGRGWAARELTSDERLMLTWSANGVGRRQMAAWLGVHPKTVDNRLGRLRKRLRHEPRDREQAGRWAHRAGTGSETAS